MTMTSAMNRGLESHFRELARTGNIYQNFDELTTIYYYLVREYSIVLLILIGDVVEIPSKRVPELGEFLEVTPKLCQTVSNWES